MDKKTNNGRHNTKKTKDGTERTSQKTEMNSCAPEGKAVPALIV